MILRKTRITRPDPINYRPQPSIFSSGPEPNLHGPISNPSTGQHLAVIALLHFYYRLNLAIARLSQQTRFQTEARRKLSISPRFIQYELNLSFYFFFSLTFVKKKKRVSWLRSTWLQLSDAPSFFLRLNDQQYKSNAECDFVFVHEKLVRTAHFFFFLLTNLINFLAETRLMRPKEMKIRLEKRMKPNNFERFERIN